MRQALALLFCSTLFAADPGSLRHLVDKSRYFDLRRAFEPPASDSAEMLFYRGQVASRFGHESEGIDLLRKALAAKLSDDLARKAHEEIAEAFDRLWRYREAAKAWDDALALTPKKDTDREGSENSRTLLTALSDVPPETAEFGDGAPIQAIRNKVGTWDVPVQVNGVAAQWIFDTGANVSTIIESEAKRLGLEVRESKAYVSGSTGKHNNLRLAVAPTVQFGSARVHNVVFLVLSDASLTFPQIKYQITGILGLPVLRALGRMELSKAGRVRIHLPAPESAAPPNLYFDASSPIVEVDHNQHHLQMLLDTGANTGALYPSVRDTLTPEEKSRLRSKQEQTGGAGGVVKIRTSMVPLMRLQILDAAIELKDLGLLRVTPGGTRSFRDGVIGMDALWSGFLLDFDTMRLEVR